MSPDSSPPRLLELPGDGEVLGLQVAPRERPHRDGPQQRLQERVLAALGRADVVRVRQHLLCHQPVQTPVDLGLGSLGDAGQRRRQ